ncbi:uncharacterized protein LOC114476484 isoform X1 [Gouania willdenowi]|uniref:Uncharacterized LOC114476484 n=1 Tax=Gouania willdenowi TaxID=441366 RepID=A0A8C5D856_GOUWI|nr:uncharacterized protein LOC114476484 isoform X1 [Gouania willdenowi]
MMGMRWCCSAVKNVSSSYALKLLIPPLCLVLVVIYGLTDKLRNFVAGLFIPQYNHHYPVAFCFGQVLVSLLVLNLLHLVTLVPLKRYSWCLGEKLLIPAICSSIQAVLSMWVKTSNSYAGLFLLILPLLPLVTVACSFCLKLTSPPSAHISVMISILSGTSVVIAASKDLSHVELLEYIYTPLAIILHSLSLTCLAKVFHAVNHDEPDSKDSVSVFDVYYAQLVNQGWVLGFLWLLHPDNPWKVLTHGSWNSLLFIGYLLAILLLGMVLDFLVGLSALCVSPLAAALLHSAKQLVQPFVLLLQKCILI